MEPASHKVRSPPGGTEARKRRNFTPVEERSRKEKRKEKKKEKERKRRREEKRRNKNYLPPLLQVGLIVRSKELKARVPPQTSAVPTQVS